MPYSGASDSSLPSNVKKMPPAKKKAWVSTFNNVYNKCKSDGGSNSTCETKAFKIANAGAKKQVREEPMNNRAVFTRIWDGFLDSIGVLDDDGEDFELIPRKKTRSTSMSRITEQLYKLLRDNNDKGEDWAYPIGLYVGDDGKSIFSIVAQSGKLFQVPLTIKKDELSMGEWTQVKEEFVPVAQSRFSVRRQKNGKYRWFAIAATSVLNRVGEIDSSTLFDNFIERAEKSGDYPRLDFYHYGLSDSEKWEFGTADYLARDGVCYLASGLFDEDHPLAKATIRSVEEGTFEDWGTSIEFYAIGDAEKISVEPEVYIPVYKDGENTRISLVLEQDAAGLFTRIGVNEEIQRAMDKTTKEALKKLFGDDEEGLKAFVSNSDSVNRTVKDENLIHRSKKKDAVKQDPEDQIEDDDDQDTDDEEDMEEDEDENLDNELVLDEAAVEAITQQMTQSEGFKAILQGLNEIKQSVAEMVVAREKDQKEIADLKKSQVKITQAVERLNKDEGEKKQEYLTDLPSRRQKVVTFKPSEAHSGDLENFEEDMEDIATRTLNGIPNAY